MEKYSVKGDREISHVIDNSPLAKWTYEICTIYERCSPITGKQVANSLNMAHELRLLSPKATKKQMLDIINKYR